MRNAPSALEVEIAGEKAAALGRSGRRLRSALDKLRKFDSAAREPGARKRTRASPESSTRKELVELAAEAYWSYIVQREALGLYHNESVVADYDIPPEVQRRMGPRPPKSRARPPGS